MIVRNRLSLGFVTNPYEPMSVHEHMVVDGIIFTPSYNTCMMEPFQLQYSSKTPIALWNRGPNL